MVKLSQLIDIKSTERDNTDFLTISLSDPYKPESDSNHSAFFSVSDNQNNNTASDSSTIDQFLKINYDAIFTVSNQESQPIEYRFVRVIDTGSYGQVLEYRQKNHEPPNELPNNLCLKVGIRVNDLENDLKILKTLPPDFQSSGLLDSVSVNLATDSDQIEPILIMPKMRGSVLNLFRKLEFSSLIGKMLIVNTVLYTISKTLLQLLEVGIYYTDLKLNNCLYQMGKSNEGEIQIYLCDLGSAFLKGQKTAMATYPQIYRKTCHDFMPELFDLQYGLMIIYFQMMLENSDNELSIKAEDFLKLFHKNIGGLTLEQRKSIIRELFQKVFELISDREPNSKTQKILINYTNHVENYLTTRHSSKQEVEKLQEICSFFKNHYSIFTERAKSK